MALSIPEIPSHTVDRENPGHLETGNDEVGIPEDVALLIGDDGAENSNFEKRGNHPCAASVYIAGGQRKDHMAAVLVDAGDVELEIASRESPQKFVAVIQLGATLVLWLIRQSLVPTH